MHRSERASSDEFHDRNLLDKRVSLRASRSIHMVRVLAQQVIGGAVAACCNAKWRDAISASMESQTRRVQRR